MIDFTRALNFGEAQGARPHNLLVQQCPPVEQYADRTGFGAGGGTARTRWPSEVTSNEGAGVSARFIWKRGRRDFTCRECALRFNSAFITWLSVVKKKRSLLLSQRTIHPPPCEIFPCKSCGSVNQKKFSVEMGIHFPELKDIDKPVVWVFPEVVVCLDCGTAEFAVPEAELRQLAKGDAAAAG